MQHIDRRWIYLVLAIVLVTSLILGKPEDPIVLQSVQQMYDAIDRAPAGPDDGKLILVGTTFGASTLGENGNQARAIFRHLMLRNKRFAVIAIGEPQGANFGPLIAGEVAAQYGREYGVDWIALGYQLNGIPTFKSLLKDIPNFVPLDSLQQQPLSSYPIMRGITSVQHDVPLMIELTASNSVLSWLAYVQPATNPRLQIVYGCTGVMAAEAYPLLDSGQLSGMAPGLKGAADYEKLVDRLETQMIAQGAWPQERAFQTGRSSTLAGMGQSARQYMFTQNSAHLAVLVFIVLGNIGLLLSRRKARAVTEEDTNG